MNRQTRCSSYKDLSLLLEKSKDIFEVQILTKILDDYKKYHVHDFKSFESLLKKDKKIECPKCHSSDISKNGKDRNGTQRFICKSCGKNFNISAGTLSFSSKINIKAWYAFLECILNGTSVAAACTTAKISTVTGSAWMKKIFKALKIYQDDIVLESPVFIDETYVHEDTSKIEYKDEIGKIKKVRKQPRGISRNKICILIATDTKKSFALIVNHGRPQRIKNYEICKKHIMPGSLLIGDEDTSLTYTASQMDLSREMYKSNTEEAYEHLKPVDQLCSRYKFFLGKHKGFKKDLLQDYTNLFIFMENEKNKTEDLFEITIKLMEMMIDY